MNFILRPWKNSDLDSLVKYANNIKIADNMTNKFPHPYTNESGKAFIEFANQDNPVHVFAIEIDEETVGGAGIFPQTDIQCKNAELGYWIGEPFWGKGIITHVIREMVEFGFRTYPIDRIFARPFGSNIASQKVLEKAGFLLEARLEKTLIKNGREEDELIYAFRRKNI